MSSLLGKLSACNNGLRPGGKWALGGPLCGGVSFIPGKEGDSFKEGIVLSPCLPLAGTSGSSPASPLPCPPARMKCQRGTKGMLFPLLQAVSPKPV